MWNVIYLNLRVLALKAFVYTYIVQILYLKWSRVTKPFIRHTLLVRMISLALIF